MWRASFSAFAVALSREPQPVSRWRALLLDRNHGSPQQDDSPPLTAHAVVTIVEGMARQQRCDHVAALVRGCAVDAASTAGNGGSEASTKEEALGISDIAAALALIARAPTHVDQTMRAGAAATEVAVEAASSLGLWGLPGVREGDDIYACERDAVSVVDALATWVAASGWHDSPARGSVPRSAAVDSKTRQERMRAIAAAGALQMHRLAEAHRRRGHARQANRTAVERVCGAAAARLVVGHPSGACEGSADIFSAVTTFFAGARGDSSSSRLFPLLQEFVEAARSCGADRRFMAAVAAAAVRGLDRESTDDQRCRTLLAEARELAAFPRSAPPSVVQASTTTSLGDSEQDSWWWVLPSRGHTEDDPNGRASGNDDFGKIGADCKLFVDHDFGGRSTPEARVREISEALSRIGFGSGPTTVL